ATVADGYRGVSVRWRRDGVLITDGPGGASGGAVGGGGGVVSGATGVLASPTNDSEVVLTIEGVRESDAGKYAAEFVNACGRVMSIEARLTVLGPRNCYGADVAGVNQSNSGDGRLTADDLIVYLGWFFARDARADIAGPNQSAEPDGELTADDVIVYIGRFMRGC
ncbi:MAG: hypothetical protein MUE97_07560, partial [Phycisphaerales bacterium]|nr:hypothetical protein [Phycisphaerales bacterium]